ncbi:MAG: hypothetical protein FJW23_14870 [Acidimicrobiia bacterium]|nr:hypothetical protein [Acidimicrobiia bacterium]
MPHPVVLALYDTPDGAARAARALRALGVPRTSVSVVARSHDEEGALADQADASPGAELEDSRRAARLGELSAHLLAAIALVVPGIGPIVADGPLAAGLGEAAGHLGGSVARTLKRAGLPPARAAAWETAIEQGACVIGAHTDSAQAPVVLETVERCGAAETIVGSWG